MNASELLAKLSSLGVNLSVDGDKLKVNAPHGVITPPLRESMVALKSELLSILQSNKSGSAIQQIKRLNNRSDSFPLSFAQQRLWFLDQLEGGTSTYNVPMVLRIEGPLSFECLQASLNALIERHETLRTQFVAQDGKPIQRTLPQLHLKLSLVDLTSHGSSAEHEFLALAQLEIVQPFDLSSVPLVRATAYHLSPNSHGLVIVLHHIISDGWSMGVFLKELAYFYDVFARNHKSTLPPLEVQYADFAAWQRNWLQGQVLENQLEYWKTQLADLPGVINLPLDHQRPAVMNHKGDVQSFSVDRQTLLRLKQFSQENQGTLFMTLLSAYGILLGRYSGQRDVVIGSPIANRNHRATEGLIGFLVNVLVLRLDLSGNPTCPQLFKRVREVCLTAYDHQDIPFEHLVEALHPERNMSHSPLFQVMLMLQNAAEETLHSGDLAVSQVEFKSPTAHFDIVLSLTETDEGLKGALEYRTDLFESQTISRMIGHFQVVLQAMARISNEPVSQFSLLTDFENRLLKTWNDRKCAYNDRSCIHQLFENRVKLNPSAVALVTRGATVSYGELNVRSNQLSHKLIASGASPGGYVGLWMEHSIEMVIALFAILKSGAAYVPFHHDWPRKRVEHIVNTLKIPLMIASPLRLTSVTELLRDVSSLQQVFIFQLKNQSTPVLPSRCSFVSAGELDSLSPSNPSTRVLPDHTAYIIFTSGSTGVPKGVVLRHKPVVNLIEWVNNTFQVNHADRLLFVTSICFDLSVYDVFGILAAGGSIRVADEAELANAEQLVNILVTEPITFWDSAPAALQQLVPLFQAPIAGANYHHLRLVFFSGDWIPLKLPDAVRSTFTSARVISLGGATEAAIWSNFFPVELVDPDWRSIPYGRPIQNAAYYVLDPDLNPCPAGVPGELHIGGQCLADGYAADPAQTAERFIPDPFSDAPGRVMYKTGDLTRFKPDGIIEILGRIDHQVKIRGFRVETGEIETVLSASPLVEHCAVLVRHDMGSGPALVAYVILRSFGEDLEQVFDSLRAHLRLALPEYMMPAALVNLPVFPMTSNGKLDRAGFPKPEQRASSSVKQAPETPRQTYLLKIWMEVLNREDIGIHDNFFSLGGDSISSIQVVARARQLGIPLSARHIFQHQTIAELAGAIPQESVSPAEQGRVSGPVPITPIQHWFLEQALARPEHFNQSLMFETSSDFEPTAFSASVSFLVEHHDALRLRFKLEHGRWSQFHIDIDSAPFWIETTFDAERANLFQQSFDLMKGPLFRAVFFQHPGRLLLLCHHLVIDAVSWGIILQDLELLYSQARNGRPLSLPARTDSFKAYAEELSSRQLSEQESLFWSDVMSGPYADLPLDFEYSPAANTNSNTHHVSVGLTSSETQSLKNSLERHRVQIDELLILAVAQSIAAWSRSSAFIIDVENHGRQRDGSLELSRTVGWFTTIHPVRLDLDWNAPNVDQFKRIKEICRAVPNRGIGFGIWNYLQNPQPTASRSARSQISFNYLGQSDSGDATGLFSKLSESDRGRESASANARRYLLEVSASITAGALEMTWSFADTLHTRSTVTALAQGSLEFLRQCIQTAEETPAYVPSDFPDVALSQQDLNSVMAEIGIDDLGE